MVRHDKPDLKALAFLIVVSGSNRRTSAAVLLCSSFSDFQPGSVVVVQFRLVEALRFPTRFLVIIRS